MRVAYCSYVIPYSSSHTLSDAHMHGIALHRTRRRRNRWFVYTLTGFLFFWSDMGEQKIQLGGGHLNVNMIQLEERAK